MYTTLIQVSDADQSDLARPSITSSWRCRAGGEDVARGFYTGVLGIPEVPKPPLLAGARRLLVRGRRRCAIHLGVEDDFRPARKAHPALVVDDLAGVRRAGRRSTSRGPTTSPASSAATSPTRSATASSWSTSGGE